MQVVFLDKKENGHSWFPISGKESSKAQATHAEYLGTGLNQKENYCQQFDDCYYIYIIFIIK